VSEPTTILLSAAVGAVAGIVSTAWKTRKDLESQYDIDLRMRRIDAYEALWKALEPLADYAAPAPMTHSAVVRLSADLRRWYFHTGGLFLSKKTRAPYFNLQNALRDLTDSPPEDPSLELDEDEREILKALASRLRTSSTDDVATRVGPRLGPSLLGWVSRPWRRGLAPVRVSIDRRWDWTYAPPVPCFFVLVENVSDRHVEVTNVAVRGAGEVRIKYENRRFRLQPREARELPAEIVGRRPEAVVRARARVTLGGRWMVESTATPDVPIPRKVLQRPSLDRGTESD
jgi:hypothetical protein